MNKEASALLRQVLGTWGTEQRQEEVWMWTVRPGWLHKAGAAPGRSHREIVCFLGHFFLEKFRLGLNANRITLTLFTAGGA